MKLKSCELEKIENFLLRRFLTSEVRQINLSIFLEKRRSLAKDSTVILLHRFINIVVSSKISPFTDSASCLINAYIMSTLQYGIVGK